MGSRNSPTTEVCTTQSDDPAPSSIASSERVNTTSPPRDAATRPAVQDSFLTTPDALTPQARGATDRPPQPRRHFAGHLTRFIAVSSKNTFTGPRPIQNGRPSPANGQGSRGEDAKCPRSWRRAE